MLQTSLAGISLRNPVLLAAGTHGTLHEIGDALDLSTIGGVVAKSVTREPRAGNDTWRVIECRGTVGMMNAIGLANPGIEAFEREYLPKAGSLACAVLCSVAGFSVEDYVAVSAALDEWAGRGVQGIELNLSCPNVEHGTEFGFSPLAAREVVREVRAIAKNVRVFVKLSPVAPELPLIAKACVEAGADGLTISNTIPAMAIDVETGRPRLSNVTGGLSGPGLHPVAVRLVHLVYQSLAKDALGKGKGVPIIGAGGVMTWEDAAEFILAGATAVQMGTAVFADPRSPRRVVRGLEKWARRRGVGSIGELVGTVRLDRG